MSVPDCDHVFKAKTITRIQNPFFFFFIGYLIEARGVHQAWDPVGCNKNTTHMEGFSFYVDVNEKVSYTRQLKGGGDRRVLYIYFFLLSGQSCGGLNTTSLFKI